MDRIRPVHTQHFNKGSHCVSWAESKNGEFCPKSAYNISCTKGSPLKTLKHRIDALDKENMIYNYTMIEGDTLLDKIESISYETKFEATADGRTICKSVSKYYPKAGVEIKEEEIKAGKEKATGMFMAVEAYLSANPDAYA
ncbi:hypothetical protein L1049_015201 [Liquidambar formosana]|uniref:Bet v I/Major latex protein domain-containing protein n=1 Tax=Liquidambar formosana TaxID=63359 RepID=A0AAP0X2C8_LIQFO